MGTVAFPQDITSSELQRFFNHHLLSASREKTYDVTACMQPGATMILVNLRSKELYKECARRGDFIIFVKKYNYYVYGRYAGAHSEGYYVHIDVYHGPDKWYVPFVKDVCQIKLICLDFKHNMCLLFLNYFKNCVFETLVQDETRLALNSLINGRFTNLKHRQTFDWMMNDILKQMSYTYNVIGATPVFLIIADDKDIGEISYYLNSRDEEPQTLILNFPGQKYPLVNSETAVGSDDDADVKHNYLSDFVVDFMNTQFTESGVRISRMIRHAPVVANFTLLFGHHVADHFFDNQFCGLKIIVASSRVAAHFVPKMKTHIDHVMICNGVTTPEIYLFGILAYHPECVHISVYGDARNTIHAKRPFEDEHFHALPVIDWANQLIGDNNSEA